MAPDRSIRAADADRERAAAGLREHFAAGRLTSGEFDERLDGIYAAKTLGELEDLMADLPGSDLTQLPATRVRRSAGDLPVLRQRGPGSIEAARGRLSPAWRAAWGSWLAISLCAFVIWLLTGASGLWFLWVAVPLAVLLLGRWITGAPRLSPPSRAPGAARQSRHQQLNRPAARCRSSRRDGGAVSIADLAIVAALVFGWGTLSARMERFDVPAPIAFVVTGLLLTHGPLSFLSKAQ